MTENTQGGTAASPGTLAANTPDVKTPDGAKQPAKPGEVSQPGKGQTRDS